MFSGVVGNMGGGGGGGGGGGDGAQDIASGLVPDRFSTTTTTAAQHIADDFVAKLRFAEEQLQNERRSRGWLEAEVQVGKSQIATLTAKVEKLTEIVSSESLNLKEIARVADQADKKTGQMAQEFGMKLERGQLKLQTIVSDLVARQKTLEYHENEENEKHRMLADELNSLRYKLESFSLMTAEVGNEVRAKARDLEYEQQRGADTMRVIKDHDHALEALHHTIDASSDSLSKRFEVTLIEIRQRVDAEARARFQFENGMRELYAEIRKTLSSQDREATDRIESARQQAAVAFERERLERERNIGLMADEVRTMEKAVKEALNAATEKMLSQLTLIDATVNQEKTARTKFETQVKSDIEGGFKLIQQAVLKKFEEMQMMQTEMRHNVGLAVKALKESVTLVEKTTDQKLNSVEDVLRAEIRSRMETDRVVDEVKKDMEFTTANTEKRAMAAIAQAIEESRENNSRLEEELKATAEQLVGSKTRQIDDLENQLELLRKRIVESDAETSAKIRMAHLAAEQMGHTAQAALEVVEARIDMRFSTEQQNVDEVLEKVKQIDERADVIKNDIEDRINFRSLQMESTMAAFKEELEQRLSKSDAADLEAKLSAVISGVKASIGNTNQTLQAVRDEVCQKTTKKDLDDAESRSKLHLAAITSRINDIDQVILGVKEDVSNRSTRKELDDHESNLKTAILNLELKGVVYDEMLEKLQSEIDQKASKKTVEDQDNRIKNFVMEEEMKAMELEENFRSVKESVDLRVTKLEVEDMEKKFSESIGSLQDRIGEVSTSIAEAKTEISQNMHDDVEEMVSSINGALDAMQARSDKIDNSVEGMKLRISESENSSRSRMQLFMNSVEATISENIISVGTFRDATAQQIKEISERLDVLPKLINDNEEQSEEFRKRLMDMSRSEEERVNQLLQDIRESIALKVNSTTLEEVQSELSKVIQKITAQQELEGMTLEQLKLKISDTESYSREKMREFRAAIEKSADEQASGIRLWKDSLSKRYEELDARTSSIPKALDQTWGELRKIKFDVEERLRNDLSHLEKELSATKNELSNKVSTRSLDGAIMVTIGPFNSRLDRLNRDMDDLRILTSRLHGELNGKIYSGISEIVNRTGSAVNIHRPPGEYFGMGTSQRGGMGSVRAPGIGIGVDDANLERIADETARTPEEPIKETAAAEF
ncbi:hypothetical protein HDU84_002784 [Entophlyctis sp. JEL0112]|nr:hypothetical protein HDU84_002784 [Entophlyctis sp. JEL0112]